MTGRFRREYPAPMALTHFPRDADPAEVAAHLRRYGYAIVDDLADEATMDQLAAEVAPFVEASDAGRDEYDGRFTRRTGALIARCPSVRQLVMHPTAVGVAQHLMAQATTIQLHLTQLITIAPGETQQKLHRDQMAFDFYPFAPDYHVQCNTMWALTDFTEENGATHILPGTSAMDDEAGLAVPEERATMSTRQLPVLRGQGAPRRWRRTAATPIAAASTSRTPSGGCARRRTSTSPPHPRSRGPSTTTCCG